MQKILEKMVVIITLSIPNPFNGFHEMKHSSAINLSESKEILKPKGKT